MIEFKARELDQSLDEFTKMQRMVVNPRDIVIIAGVRLRRDGTYTRRCKPGNETRFEVLSHRQIP